MAPFSLILRKNKFVCLNHLNFGGHLEDFWPILQLLRKTPKIRGAKRSVLNHLAKYGTDLSVMLT